MLFKKLLKINKSAQPIPQMRTTYLHRKFRIGEIRNFKILLILQVLTLIAATIGSLTYFIIHKEPHKGEVKGILYTGINSTAMIDNQVLEEGDTIYGIKIVKIHPKKVEFAKDGKTWSQKICEYPNPAWKNSQE